MGSMLLRRATQIVNRINRESAFEIEAEPDEYYGRRKKKTQTLTATVTTNIDGHPTQRIKSLRENLLNKQTRMFRLMQIGTKIRQEMGVQQAKCGVTAMVTERVMVVKQQHVIETLLNSTTNVLDESELAEQVAAMKKRLENATQGSATADITTALLTKSDRDTLQQQLTVLKRRQLDIDDKLAELNSTNSISLTDEDERYLREVGIA